MASFIVSKGNIEFEGSHFSIGEYKEQILVFHRGSWMLLSKLVFKSLLDSLKSCDFFFLSIFHLFNFTFISLKERRTDLQKWSTNQFFKRQNECNVWKMRKNRKSQKNVMYLKYTPLFILYLDYGYLLTVAWNCHFIDVLLMKASYQFNRE